MNDRKNDGLSQEDKEWIKRRVDAVNSKYSAFDALMEIGVDGLVDTETAVSVFCPFHVNTKTPAARYYPSSGSNQGSLFCFSCRKQWGSINIIMDKRGLRFMEALVELEKRFRIQIPRKPNVTTIELPKSKDTNYLSSDRLDVPKMLGVLEKKLIRIRDAVPLQDYVKFCRVLDNIAYDHEKFGVSTNDMVNTLHKLKEKMDGTVTITRSLEEINAPNESD